MKIIDISDIIYPENFNDTLSGLSIEEQMNRFRVTESIDLYDTAWKKRTPDMGAYKKLEESEAVKSIVVSDGFIVGVMIENYLGWEELCMPEENICIRCTDDSDSGYAEDYISLICVSENFDSSDVKK